MFLKKCVNSPGSFNFPDMKTPRRPDIPVFLATASESVNKKFYDAKYILLEI
jgi:hypothetical protein